MNADSIVSTVVLPWLRAHLRPVILIGAGLVMIAGLAVLSHGLVATGLDPHASSIAQRKELSVTASSASARLAADHARLASAIGAPDPVRVARDIAVVHTTLAAWAGSGAVTPDVTGDFPGQWRGIRPDQLKLAGLDARVTGVAGQDFTYAATARFVPLHKGTNSIRTVALTWRADAAGHVSGLAADLAATPVTSITPTVSPSR